MKTRGTTDITIHVKKGNGELEEIRRPSGKNVGGRQVELRLFSWLESILGYKLLKRLKEKKPNSHLRILREFENAKKNLKNNDKEKLPVNLPRHDLEALLRDQYPNTFTLDTHIQKCRMDTRRKDEIIIDAENLWIDPEEIKREMRPVIANVLTLIQSAIKDNNISIIILVGGFAESELLQAAVRETFKNMSVIVPEDASLAVLNGAVLFGHNPAFINPRKTRYTYGVNNCTSFKANIHDESRKFTDDWGCVLCRDCFSHVIGKNESVPLGKTINKRYCTVGKNQKLMAFTVYACENEPIYADEEGNKKIGRFEAIITNPSSTVREVEVEFIFWDTELKIKATDIMDGRPLEATIKLF